MSQIIEVKVPDIGDFAEVPVIELYVKVGDTIKVDDAFATLASNGRPLGIRFQNQGESVNADVIHRTFAEYQFPESLEAAFAASLRTEH